MCSGVYVVMPEDYKNPDVDHMLDCARVAEKKVRDTVKDGYQFYNPSQWEKGKWISDVVGHLKFAIRELFSVSCWIVKPFEDRLIRAVK